MADFKKLSAVDTVNAVSNAAHVLIEENGVIKKTPKSEIGAQVDWDIKDETSTAFLKNKPCYDTREYGDNVVTFDGNMTDKERIEVQPGEGYLVKISDKTPSKEKIIGAHVTIATPDGLNEVEVTSDLIEDNPNGWFTAEPLLVASADIDLNGMPLTAGMWTMCWATDGVSELYITSISWYGVTTGELKQLDEKYIPDPAYDFVLETSDFWISSINTDNLKLVSGDIAQCIEKVRNGIAPKALLRIRETYGEEFVNIVDVEANVLMMNPYSDSPSANIYGLAVGGTTKHFEININNNNTITIANSWRIKLEQ